MAKQPGKRSSIRKELILTISVLLVAVIGLLCGVSYFYIRTSTTESLEKSMKETSELISNKLSRELDVFDILANTAWEYYKQNEDQQQVDVTYLSSLAQKNNLKAIDIIGPDKQSLLTGQSYQDNDSLDKAKNLTFYLSDPIVEGEDVHFDFVSAFEDGSVLLTVPYEYFSTMIQSVQLGETGSTYVLDNTGAKVIHNDKSLVVEHQNNLEEVLKDPATYDAVAALETDMVNGNSGFGFYTWKGDKKFGSYAPIAGTNGWSVNVTALESEFMAKLNTSLIFMLIIGAAVLALAVVMVALLVRRMVKPIDSMVTAIDQLYRGDLSVEIPVVRQDEVGLIADRLNGMVQGYRVLIRDISTVLNSIANENLNIAPSAEYPGDFGAIRSSIETIIDHLNEVMSQFKNVAEQVDMGAGQLSGGAQSLSSGVTEQAGAVEQLSSTLNQVSEKIRTTSGDAQSGDKQVEKMMGELTACNEKMHSLIEAMGQISDASSQIGTIIHTIEDIAFQTNILALNAAVEAARAGELGKGFAVVADEVRNLAGKSAEAAKDTTQLIQASIEAVRRGSASMDETASSLTHTFSMARQMSQTVRSISVSAENQAQSIAEINVGLEQVSSVVQTNSATAEQTAAFSEELAAQADKLKELIERFTLKKEKGSAIEL